MTDPRQSPAAQPVPPVLAVMHTLGLRKQSLVEIKDQRCAAAPQRSEMSVRRRSAARLVMLVQDGSSCRWTTSIIDHVRDRQVYTGGVGENRGKA